MTSSAKQKPLVRIMLELLSHKKWYCWLGGFQVWRKLHREHWVRPDNKCRPQTVATDSANHPQVWPVVDMETKKLSSLDHKKQKKTFPYVLNLHSCGGKKIKKSQHKTSAHKHKKKKRQKWGEKITIAKTVFYVKKNPRMGKNHKGKRGCASL